MDIYCLVRDVDTTHYGGVLAWYPNDCLQLQLDVPAAANWAQRAYGPPSDSVTPGDRGHFCVYSVAGPPVRRA